MRTDERSGCGRWCGIVVPFRDAPSGRMSTGMSLPPTTVHGPDEFGGDGMDGGAAARFAERAHRRRELGSALTTARAGRPDAKSHPTNVIRHCYKATRSGAALVAGIDLALRAAAMRSLGAAGGDRVAAASEAKRSPTRGPPGYIRLASLHARATADANALAGPHRARLPYHASDREGEHPRSPAGPATTWITVIRANGTHRVVTPPGINEDSPDLHNPDCPWRQFDDSIRRSEGGLPRRPGVRWTMRAAAAGSKAAAYQRLHLARGRQGALPHPDPGACEAARRCALVERVTEHELAHAGNRGGQGLTGNDGRAIWGRRNRPAGARREDIKGRRPPRRTVNAARRRPI